MKNRLRFYIDIEGNDDSAVSEVIQKAIQLEHAVVAKRIVFIAHTLQNDGWLERQFERDGVNKLKKGARLNGSDCNSVFMSLKNYSPSDNEIVITLGLDSDDILKIEDNYGIQALIAIPWLRGGVDKWAKMSGAIELRTNQALEAAERPDAVVCQAFENLSKSINMSTGIHHHMDEERAKTYLRALHKYEYHLNEEKIENLLVGELKWTKDHAEDVLEIIRKINNGKSFQGGAKTGLKSYITQWINECNQ